MKSLKPRKKICLWWAGKREIIWGAVGEEARKIIACTVETERKTSTIKCWMTIMKTRPKYCALFIKGSVQKGLVCQRRNQDRLTSNILGNNDCLYLAILSQSVPPTHPHQLWWRHHICSPSSIHQRHWRPYQPIRHRILIIKLSPAPQP
jgi:hypothetical protein